MSTETTTKKKIEVFIFNNRRTPLRTSNDSNHCRLGSVYNGFGGYGFEYVESVQTPGKFFAWTYYNPAYSDQSSYNEWLGEFTDLDSLRKIIREIDPPDCAKIEAYITDGEKWELPED